MNLDSFTGPGSTPSRRRFWDKVTAAVIASQKVAGKNVSVDEHQSYGSLISVNPQRQGQPATSDLCITFEGITSPCGCVATVGATRDIFHLEGLNGTYQVPLISPDSWYLFIDDGSSCWNVERWLLSCIGEPFDTISGPVEIFVAFDGTDYVIRLRISLEEAVSAFYGSGPGPSITDTHSCGDSTDIGPAYGIGGTATISTPPCDTPNPCGGTATGGCCLDFECTIQTEADCIEMGGEYQGDGTFCHPPPCGSPPPTGACCNFDDNTCTITTEADCPETETETWLGPDTVCDGCGFSPAP